MIISGLMPKCISAEAAAEVLTNYPDLMSADVTIEFGPQIDSKEL